MPDSVRTVGQDSSHHWSVREECADFAVDIERPTGDRQEPRMADTQLWRVPGSTTPTPTLMQTSLGEGEVLVYLR